MSETTMTPEERLEWEADARREAEILEEELREYDALMEAEYQAQLQLPPDDLFMPSTEEELFMQIQENERNENTIKQ